MSYATVSDLSRRLGRFFSELYLDSEGEVSEEWAAADVEDAEAEVDACLAARFAIPVTAEASLPLARSWTLAFAEELAWGRGGRDKIPDSVSARAKSAREQLAEVAKGVYSLPGAAGRSESDGAAIFASSAEPVFTRDKMSGW